MNIKICKILLEKLEEHSNPLDQHVYVKEICGFLEREFGRLDFMGDRVIGGKILSFPENWDTSQRWIEAQKYVHRLIEIEKLNDEMDVIKERLAILKSGG